MGIYERLNSRKQETTKKEIPYKAQDIQDKVEPLMFLLTRKCTTC